MIVKLLKDYTHSWGEGLEKTYEKGTILTTDRELGLKLIEEGIAELHVKYTISTANSGNAVIEEEE